MSSIAIPAAYDPASADKGFYPATTGYLSAVVALMLAASLWDSALPAVASLFTIGALAVAARVAVRSRSASADE